ncbi:MAG: electron transfer flavoprotein alpha subunit, partial [Cognaticolwellia sp.]|jgi:electron transfer flavoprotein alpha subunit
MVLIFAESQNNQHKKSTFEAVYYGSKVAALLGTEAIALVIGDADNSADLGLYGASKVLKVGGVNHFDSQVYTAIITEVAEKIGASTIIVNHSSTGKSLIGRLSIRFKAGSVSAANALPTVDDGFKVTKNVFSGKAGATYEIKTPRRVISLSGNSLPPEVIGSAVTPEAVSVNIPQSRIKFIKQDTIKGTVPLPEAELVVSAGRGMKGPENWGIIEEMADILGATTACSRPVADIDWRPHHEHVGQTGVAIKPNLYIAIGISGAIQHLAGVNQSKVIVVINKDPEAPFFKAADYGVVGDLFEVVPRLNEALRKFKAS